MAVASATLSLEDCYYQGMSAIEHYGQVGQDCMQGLHLGNHLHQFKVAQLMEFDNSAWNYVEEKYELLEELYDVKGVFLKSRPDFCGSVMTLRILCDHFLKVSVPKSCFDQLSSSMLEQLSLEEIFVLSKKSLGFYELLEGRLMPYSEYLVQAYGFYMENDELPIFKDDFLDFPVFSSFMETFKSYFMKPDENTYDLFKCACQIIGDSLISHKSIYLYSSEYKLEGLSLGFLYSRILEFLKDFTNDLDGINEPEIFDSNIDTDATDNANEANFSCVSHGPCIDSNTLADLIVDVRSLIFFSTLQSSAFELENEIFSLIVSQFYHKIVSSLTVSNYVIIPHGYCSKIYSGHATLCKMTKKSDNEILMDYFNTGEGIKYHAVIQDPENPLKVKWSHKLSFLIPEEELNFQFWNVFMSTVVNSIERWSISDVYEGALGIFPVEYMITQFDSEDIFISGQNSGSCVFSSLFTWMRTKFERNVDFERFGLSLKMRAFDSVEQAENLRLYKERKGLELLLHLAEEIEREAEKLVDSEFRDFALSIGTSINSTKKYISYHLSANRNNFDNISTMKIDLNTFQGVIPDLNRAFDTVHEWINYRGISNKYFLDYSNFVDNVYQLSRYQGHGNLNRSFLNFMLETAIKWDIERGEYFDTNTHGILNIFESLLEIPRKLLKTNIVLFNDETTLLLRLTIIQLWHLLGLIEPKVLQYRPYFKFYQLNGTANLNCLSVMQKTVEWSEEGEQINLFHPLSFTGKQDKAAQSIINFAELFYDRDAEFVDCKFMSSKMRKFNFLSPALILSRCADNYFKGLLAEENQQFRFMEMFKNFIEIIKASQQTILSAEVNPYIYDVEQDRYSFKKIDFGEKGKVCRLQHVELFTVYPLDSASKFDINSIMASKLASDRDFITEKIIKQSKILFEMNEELRQYMLIVFLARRPLLFRQIRVLNLFYQNLSFKGDSNTVWDSHRNLISAWKNAIIFILKYHRVAYMANRSLSSLTGLQNTILFTFNLINLNTADHQVCSTFADSILEFLEAYQDAFCCHNEAKEEFIHPYYFFAIYGYFKRNFVDFAAYYLAAEVDYNKAAVGAYLDLTRIFEDMIGRSLFYFRTEATVENMKLVARKASTLARFENIDFNNLAGAFPYFQSDDSCFIDLMQRKFSTFEQSNSFSPQQITGLDNFCKFEDFFGDLDRNLKKHVQGVDYEFVLVDESTYRLSFVLNGDRFFLIDHLKTIFTKSGISESLYSLWCSTEKCLLKKFERETLQTELICEFNSNIVVIDSVEREFYHGPSIVGEFFPAHLAVGTCVNEQQEYIILHYLDHNNEQLELFVQNGNIYVGSDKSLFSSVEDLLSHKNCIYKLDTVAVLTLFDSRGQRFAFFPSIPSSMSEWYSRNAIWINGRRSEEIDILLKSSNMTSFIKTYLIPVDSTGFLQPSSTLELSVVSFYYLIAGEYELAMHFLQLINHRVEFSAEEELSIDKIIDWADNFPAARSVRMFAVCILFMNYHLHAAFNQMNPRKISREGLYDKLLIAYSSYVSVESHISRNMRLFYSSSDPFHSILSQSESEFILSDLSKVLGKITPKSIYHDYKDGAVDGNSYILNLDDCGSAFGSFIFPKISVSSDNSKLLHFLFHGSYSKEKFCDVVRFIRGPLSMITRRVIQEICCSLSHSYLDEIIKNHISRPQFMFEYKFDTSNCDLSPSESSEPLESEFIIFESITHESLKICEVALLGAFDEELLALIDKYNEDLIKSEITDEEDCSSLNSFVEINICRGEIEIMKTRAKQSFTVNFMHLHRKEFMDKLKKLIPRLLAIRKTFKSQIARKYGTFTGKSVPCIDENDESSFFDQYLLKFVRRSPSYIFELYFPEKKATEVHQEIFDFFLLQSQISRLSRILNALQSAEDSSDISAYLLSISDDLITELSHRPEGILFKPEIILFEKAQNVRLRVGNLESYVDLFTSKENCAVQKVMGSGKTFVLGSLGLVSASEDEFSMLVAPVELLETNASNTIAMNMRSFGQKGYLVNISRCYSRDESMNHCLNFFTALHSILQTCIARGHFVMTSRESLLSLYNSYKELVINSEHSNLSKIVEDIIKLIRSKGFAILDEVDSILYPHYELNYPISPSQQIDEKLARAIITVFEVLSTDQEIRSIYDVLDLNSLLTSQEDFNKMKDILMNRLIENEFYQQCIANDGSEESCKRQFERFFNIILKDCLRGRLNVTYGSMEGVYDLESLRNATVDIFARPYEGSNRPSQLSEFADVLTSLTYTLMMYLKKDISCAQKIDFFTNLAKLAESEAVSLASEEFKRSTVGLSFDLDKTVVGKMLSEFCGKSNVTFSFLSTPDAKKMEFLENNCFMNKKNLPFIFAYIEKIVVPTITKTSEQVSSCAQDLFKIFKRFSAYSGTIDNVDIFSSTDKVKLDDVALGTIMYQLVSKKTEVSLIYSSSSILEIINQVKESFPEKASRIRAFIDTAAVLNESSNKDLVDACIKAFNLKGGLYFKTGEDSLFFSDEFGTAIPIKKTDGLYLQETTKLRPDERFSFYDEVHTRGVDIVQDSNSVALVTICSSTSLSDLLQGILRMRKFFGNQEVIFLLVKQGGLMEKFKKPLEEVNAFDILKMTRSTQENNVMADNQTIFIQKMVSLLNDYVILYGYSFHYQLLIRTYLFEIEMMKLNFDERIEKYLSHFEPIFTRISNLQQVITDFRSSWMNRIQAVATGKAPMTKNCEINNQLHDEQQVEVQRQNVQLDLNELNWETYQAVSSLPWTVAKIENSPVNHEILVNHHREQPELISWHAINSALGSTGSIPKNVYFSSNFVQIKQEMHYNFDSFMMQYGSNTSFKLHRFSDLYARRDQFGFFIAAMRHEMSATEYSLYFFEPAEVTYWLDIWKAERGENTLLLSSNGDLIFPEVEESNIFRMQSEKLPFSWDVNALASKLLETAYQAGMFEIFSNFLLDNELSRFENLNADSSFKCQAFLLADPEVEQVSILSQVLKSGTVMECAREVWCRHLTLQRMQENKSS